MSVMKNVGVMFLLLPILTFAELNMDKVNSVLLNITASKELLYYSTEVNIGLDKKLKFTSLDNADIVLFPKKSLKNKIIIATSYQELKDNKNSIGAVFLKKHRTQIIFIKERLQNKGLSLPRKFNNYIYPLCHINATCL